MTHKNIADLKYKTGLTGWWEYIFFYHDKMLMFPGKEKVQANFHLFQYIQFLYSVFILISFVLHI